MAAASPAPPRNFQAARPAYWFPLAFFGAVVALSVPVYARSRPLVIAALAYTAAALVADWPTLSSAPSALLVTGGDPVRTLISISSRVQSAEAALLPAAVLLVAAVVAFVLPARFRGQPQVG